MTLSKRIAGQRQRTHFEQARTERHHEPGRTGEHASPALPFVIDASNHDERQLLVELPVLLVHEIAQRVLSRNRNARADAQAVLHGAFAAVKGVARTTHSGSLIPR